MRCGGAGAEVRLVAAQWKRSRNRRSDAGAGELLAEFTVAAHAQWRWFHVALPRCAEYDEVMESVGECRWHDERQRASERGCLIVIGRAPRATPCHARKRALFSAPRRQLAVVARPDGHGHTIKRIDL